MQTKVSWLERRPETSGRALGFFRKGRWPLPSNWQSQIGVTHPPVLRAGPQPRLRFRIDALALPLFLTCACGAAAPTTSSPTSPIAAAAPATEIAPAAESATTATGFPRLSRNVIPERYELSFSIDPNATRFGGLATIHARLNAPTERIAMHGQNMTVTQVQVVQGQRPPIAAQVRVLDAEHGAIELVLEHSVGAGAIRIEMAWNAPFDPSLAGLYLARAGGESYAFTQFEATSARKAFPCFDEPGFKTPFDVSIIAPSDQLAVANTRELERTPQANGRTLFRFARTAPLPTYLVAFAVGHFDVREGTLPANEVRTTPLPFRILSTRGTQSETQYAFDHTAAIVQAIETYFAIPYPFDKLDFVAVPDFGSGAMENAGLITFRDSFLRLGEQSSQQQREVFTYVAAHELAHQWFGDMVTMEFWDDLWLNEAFASWMETRIVHTAAPEYEAALSGLAEATAAMAADTLASARVIREPIRTYGDIVNAFDTITYAKGSRVIEMIETWLGAETFRRGMSIYFQRHRFANATYSDLVAALSEAAHESDPNRDVAAVFSDFANQTGVPLVTISRADNDGQYVLTVSEYTPLGRAASPTAKSWHVPVCLKAPTSGANWVRVCREVGSEPVTVALEGAEPGVVLGNAEGSGYYVYTLGAGMRAPTRFESAIDELASAQNTGAELRSGNLSFSEALLRLAPLARSSNRLLSQQPLELLGWAEQDLIGDAERPYFRRYARGLFEPSYTRLGFVEGRTETLHSRSQRDQALYAMLFLASDGAVRRSAHSLAAELLRGHWDVVAPDVVGTILRAEMEFGTAETFALLREKFAAEEVPGRRRALLTAMSTFHGVSSSAVLTLPLSTDVRDNEVVTPIFRQMDRRETRVRTLTFVVENMPALRARLGEDTERLFRLPFALTSEEEIAHWRPQFVALVGNVDGAARNLDLALEEATRRAARLAHDQDSARAFFSARGMQ